MPRLAHKHDRAIRYAHWLNAIVLPIMIWSGLLIYWAYDPYEITWNGAVVVHFFPDWFYETLSLQGGLATGMAYHFAFMWLFAINGILYVTYSFWSGHWRELRPTWRTPLEAFHVVLHDLKLHKRPLPPSKFNAAQKLAYCGVVLMGAGSLATGAAIYRPTQLAWLTWTLGGYQSARLIHFILTLGYGLFFLIHVTEVVRAGWNNFRSMVTGYELVSTAEVTNDDAANPAPATVR